MNAPAPRIALGTAFEPRDAGAARWPRLLVLRHWLPGIPRGAVDQWERDLGPSEALLAAARDGTLAPAAFLDAYREEMARRESLVEWVARMAVGVGVALVCGRHPEPYCHRAALGDLVVARAREIE